MGLILDTSILIAEERGKFDMVGFLRGFPSTLTYISAIVAAELLHGIERAPDPARRAHRQRQNGDVLANQLVRRETRRSTPALHQGKPVAGLDRRGAGWFYDCKP